MHSPFHETSSIGAQAWLLRSTEGLRVASVLAFLLYNWSLWGRHMDKMDMRFLAEFCRMLLPWVSAGQTPFEESKAPAGCVCLLLAHWQTLHASLKLNRILLHPKLPQLPSMGHDAHHERMERLRCVGCVWQISPPLTGRLTAHHTLLIEHKFKG